MYFILLVYYKMKLINVLKDVYIKLYVYT